MCAPTIKDSEKPKISKRLAVFSTSLCHSAKMSHFSKNDDMNDFRSFSTSLFDGSKNHHMRKPF